MAVKVAPTWVPFTQPWQKLGMNILVIALEQCKPSTANARDRWWIKKLSPTLNVRDVPRHSRRLELLFRANLVPKIPARERLRDTIYTGMRCSKAWCGTPPNSGVVNMVGTRNFTCYMGAL